MKSRGVSTAFAFDSHFVRAGFRLADDRSPTV
jgi:predicted nucleic acid-binding protein